MLICANFLMAQDDDLLKSLDSASVGDKTMTSATAFKALQVVNILSSFDLSNKSSWVNKKY